MLFQKTSSSLAAALVLLAVGSSWHLPSSLAQELTTTPAQKELIRTVMRNIPFPIGRYTPWGALTTEMQTELTAALEYDERTWNRPGRNKMEAFEYDRVCLKATGERTDSCDALDLLVEVGFTTAQSYECWAGHYDSYDWSDLQEIGADVHFEALGWSELAWTSQNETLVPQSFSVSWAGLDEAEQNAAIQLCYLPELWDEERLTGNWIDIYAPIYETATQELDDAMAAIMPSFPLERFVPYAFLDQDTLEVTAVLEYTENRWEKPGRFNLEEYPFDQLCEEWDGLPAGTQDCETVDALKMLGFTAESWDCWMFHYNYETWDELVASGKAQYYEEIGWTEAVSEMLYFHLKK